MIEQVLKAIEDAVTLGLANEQSKWDFSRIEPDSYGYYAKLGGLTMTQVDQQGGEGQGDYYHVVYEVEMPDGTKPLVLFSGHYDSWNGISWEYGDKRIVTKQEKMVTFYD